MKTYFSSLKNVIKQKPFVHRRSPERRQNPPKRTVDELNYLTQRSVDMAGRYQPDNSLISHVNVRDIDPEIGGQSTIDRPIESRDFDCVITKNPRVDMN